MRLWLLAIALLVPLASAQSVVQPTDVPATLYMHVIGVQDMPINTQEPPEDYVGLGSYGAAVMTLRCVHGTTGEVAAGFGTGGTTAQNFAKAYGYNSPSDVEYGYRSADGSPRTHPERGVADDIIVSDAAVPVLTWYVAVGTSVGYEDVQSPPEPSPVANAHVQATVRAVDAISVDDAAYDAGRLLMRGTSAAATLMADQVIPGPSGSADGVRAVGFIAGHWVYEFTIPLEVVDPTILATEGYNVRIDVAFDLPQCDPAQEATFLPASIGSISVPGARPRLDLTVEQGFAVQSALASWEGDDLVLQLKANSVWGDDDLDLDALRIDVSGPGQAAFVKQPDPVRYHGHAHPTPGPEVTWVWEDANKTAPRGHYDVMFTLPNRQHTAELQVTLGFDKEPANDAPGLGPVALLGLLALAVVLRRR